MALDIKQLLKPMVDAAKTVIGKKWPDVQTYAETEFKKIGENILMIEKMKLQGNVSETQAKILMDLQKNASRVVLLTLESIGLIMAEQTINAALGAIRDVVNKTIGFALL